MKASGCWTVLTKWRQGVYVFNPDGLPVNKEIYKQAQEVTLPKEKEWRQMDLC
jgi:hypothetical protein